MIPMCVVVEMVLEPALRCKPCMRLGYVDVKDPRH